MKQKTKVFLGISFKISTACLFEMRNPMCICVFMANKVNLVITPNLLLIAIKTTF